MKLATWVSTAGLSLVLGGVLLGTGTPIQAQDQRDEAKPAQPEPRPETNKPSQDSPRPDEAKPADRNEEKPTPRNEKPSKQEQKPSKDDAKSEKQSEHGGQSAQHERGTADRRGSRIPDDKFRSNFGRQHTFVVQRPTNGGGEPRFQYGGYWFTMVDAWPMGWDYADECYIDDIDGEYFLFDLAHPGVRIAVVVVE